MVNGTPMRSASSRSMEEQKMNAFDQPEVKAYMDGLIQQGWEPFDAEVQTGLHFGLRQLSKRVLDEKGDEIVRGITEQGARKTLDAIDRQTPPKGTPTTLPDIAAFPVYEASQRFKAKILAKFPHLRPASQTGSTPASK